jgi:protein-S-isoprenylcysteine O-methyltransferase Ste14
VDQVSYRVSPDPVDLVDMRRGPRLVAGVALLPSDHYRRYRGRMWAEQRHPGLTAERQNIENLQNAKAWDKVLAPLMAVSIGYPLVIVAGLDHHYHWSPEFPLWLNVIGFILISLGYAFAAWALAENRFFYSVVLIQTDRGHVVCDSGPYRIVRHPGYAGNIFPLFGIVLALGSVWTLIPVAVASIISVIRTVLEDRTLQEELPGYRDYAAPVKFELVINLKTENRQGSRPNCAPDAARPCRRGDRIAILFAAVRESGIGPKQTWASAPHMSAFRGKADMVFCSADVR